MKKPYIKKFSEISKFTVWIVDGRYIRENIDEEFTNFGQHYRFVFIPEYELWVDKQYGAGEEKFYIDHMLAEHKLMSKGVDYDTAIEKADKIEQSERAKSAMIKQNLKLKKDHAKLVNLIHKKQIRSFGNKLKIWVVNGELVRDFFFLDFTEGGHDKVYNFIPEKEIWLDDDLSPTERKFVLLHEVHERNLMVKGLKYDDAHKDSSKIEFYCRHHQRETFKKIKAEFKKVA
jgi:hypothetical protein